MKRNGLSLIAFVLCCLVLGGGEIYAQGWTDDGTVVRLTTSTDNVGVGTTTPATKLDVAGTVTAQLFSTGSSISKFGLNAGLSTTGIDNSFFGISTGQFNTTGYSNSFFGSFAGYFNTSGYGNSIFGKSAGRYNTTGSFNSFFGEKAGYVNTTGNDNAFFGVQSGYSNTTGFYNSFFGENAGYSNTTAVRNSFFGRSAGFYNTTGYENSFFGQQAGYANTTGHWNSFFGVAAGYDNTSGYWNSFFGVQAGRSNTTGNDNSFFGNDAGYSNTTGSSNSFFGKGAGYSNTAASFNSFFGWEAGRYNTTGNTNSFFGYWAGLSNTTGYANSFFGLHAGRDNTTGNSNSFVGYWAGSANTTGIQRTGVGYSANNTGAAFNNSTGLGYDADCTASNQVRIGNSSVTSIGGFANWTNISDSRFKKNVQEDVKGLDFIMALRPVSYNLDLHGVEDFFADHYGERPIETLPLPGQYDKESIRYSGFVAQEVEAAAKSVGYDFSGVDAPKNSDDFYGLRYAEFVVPLVKAVQELEARIDGTSGKPSIPTAPTKVDATPTLEALAAALAVLTTKLSRLESVVSKLERLGTPRSVAEPIGDEEIEETDPALKTGPESINLLSVPEEYKMSVNFPNPFNPSTTVQYAVPQTSHVSIEIYNMLGQSVRILVDEVKTAGYHTVQWDGRNEAGDTVSSGTYLYKMQAGEFVQTQKMVMAK